MSSAVREIFWVYLALLVLLALTVIFSLLPLGAWSAPVALLIAAAKAILVLLFFMKLKDSNNSLRLMALAALLWLFFLMSLTAADYLTR